LGERWIALDEHAHLNHTVYRIELRSEHAQRRAVAHLGGFAKAQPPHTLSVDQYALDDARGLWIATPYTGSHDGLLTLDQLIRMKGGRLGVTESLRALGHLLAASSAARRNGLLHGALGGHEVLVDRHGSLLIELYGLNAAVRGLGESNDDAARDEVLSIAGLAYQALTGLDASVSFIEPSRVCRKLERGWDEWFARAMDPTAGFDTSAEAIDALPDGAADRDRAVAPSEGQPKRGVLRRLRLAVWADTNKS
jgi:hypothetical protein